MRFPAKRGLALGGHPEARMRFFLLFFCLFLIPLGCSEKKRDSTKLKVKDKALVCNWISEGLFSIRSYPLSLASSPFFLSRGDFLGGGREEIVLYSPYLPNLYLFSPCFTLLKKLPSPSLPPKIFSLSGRNFLVLTNGKEVFFFTKGQGENLTRPYRLRLADSCWLKDFFVSEEEGKMRVWTLEEKGEETFLFSYSLPARGGKIISQERLPGQRFLAGREENLFILGDKKIYARGKNNWEDEFAFNNFMVRGACSADGKTLFLLLFDSTSKRSGFLTYQIEDGKKLQEKILEGNGIFFNDFSLYDFDNDGKEEVVLTYSGREGGIWLLKGEKVFGKRKFAPFPLYRRMIVYLLGIFATDEGDEILVNLLLEKEKGEREDWLYRLSPQLKTREACDLEDIVYAFTPLGNGFLTVGEGLAIYRWE